MCIRSLISYILETVPILRLSAILKISGRFRKPEFRCLFPKSFQVFYNLIVLYRQFYAAVHEEDVSWCIVRFSKSIEEHGHQRIAQFFRTVTVKSLPTKSAQFFGLLDSSQTGAAAPSPMNVTWKLPSFVSTLA